MSTTVTFNVEAFHNLAWRRVPSGDYAVNCRAWRVMLAGTGAEFEPMAHPGYPENLDQATTAVLTDPEVADGNEWPYWFTLADLDLLEHSGRDFKMSRYDYDVALTLDVAEPALDVARECARKYNLRPEQVRVIAVLS